MRHAVQESNDEEEDNGLPLGGTDAEIREAIKKYENEIIEEAKPQDEPIANRTKSKTQENIKTGGVQENNKTVAFVRTPVQEDAPWGFVSS